MRQKIGYILCTIIIGLLISFHPTVPQILIANKQTNGIISPLPYSKSDRDQNVLGANILNQPVFALEKEPIFDKAINVLLLGLDSRKGAKSSRCDAIHLFTLNFPDKKITITHIPRGTAIYIPNTSKEGSYLSNSCSIMGIEYAKKNIEKITGENIDYTIKVGFSQTLGILRTLNIPATSALQFLRNRRFAIGDNQRSRNQAVFIKDTITHNLSIVSKMPKALKYLLYKAVDTDLDFETSQKILEYYIQLKIDQHPDDIEIITKPEPSKYVKEMHLSSFMDKETQDMNLNTDPAYNSVSNNSQEASDASEFIENANNTPYSASNGDKHASDTSALNKDGRLNDNSALNDYEFNIYQENIEKYLSDLIRRCTNFLQQHREAAARNLIKVPYNQKIWLQLEDKDSRLQYQYQMLVCNAYVTDDKNSASSQILDFITLLEQEGKKDMINQAKDLITKME